MKLQAKPVVQMGRPIDYKANNPLKTVALMQGQLLQLRKRSGMSQQEASEALMDYGINCSQRAIGYWEQEARQISWRVMVALLQVYGCEVVVK